MNKRNRIWTMGLVGVLILGVLTNLYAGQKNNGIPVEAINLGVIKAKVLDVNGTLYPIENTPTIEALSPTTFRVELNVSELALETNQEFDEMRLVLDENNYIQVNGATYPLNVPSGQTSGLKIKKSFSIGTETIAVLFELKDLLSYNKGKGYSLSPVIKDAVIVQINPDPYKPTFREYLDVETEAINLANEYLNSEKALNSTPDERMEALISIPYVVKVSCSEFSCTYTLATGLDKGIFWNN